MDKVIVERPRIGSRFRSRKKEYRKYLKSLALEELLNKEPMLGRWKGRERELNEHLGPMKRFLRSNVGRDRLQPLTANSQIKSFVFVEK